MEEKKQQVVIQCKHCATKMRWAVPKAQGTFRIPCPKCKGENIIKLAPKQIKIPQAETATGKSSAKIVMCPDCQAKMRFQPKQDGSASITCPQCNTSISINIKAGEIAGIEKKGTKPLASDANMSSGRLVRLGNLLKGIGKKSYKLRIGINSIGRYDENLHSDIEIKNDSTMSRRSIVIEVIQKENGYLFKLKVLKAANPMMHNDKPLIEGEAVYLNYGDSIKLGKTAFVFEKAT